MMQKMLSQLRRCVDDYNMIAPGDKIVVGASGGKDSTVLLRLLAELRLFYPNRFQLFAVTLDMGFTDMDFAPLTALCDQLSVPHIVKKTEIKHVVFDIRQEQNPCSLCAKMRRGALNDVVLELGSNKLALGHHEDDAIETFFLSLFYEGRINCFSPVTHLDRTGVFQIRPMLYLSERKIVNFAKREELPIIYNPCPANKSTKREDVKCLVKELEGKYPDLKKHVFGAIQRLPLPGWEREEPHQRQKRDK